MDTQQHLTALDIAIGTAVSCRDGYAGHVSRLVTEPNSRHVTHLIMRYGLPHQQRVVPIERVAQARDGTLVLDLDRAGLAALPRFAEVDYTLPDTSGHPGRSPDMVVADALGYTPSGYRLSAPWRGMFVDGHTHRGMPPEEVPIGRRTRITCRDGRVGRLDHVLLDPRTDLVRSLVVRRGHMLHREVIVPASRVEWIAEDEIRIDADRAALDELPEYRREPSNARNTSEVQE